MNIQPVPWRLVPVDAHVILQDGITYLAGAWHSPASRVLDDWYVYPVDPDALVPMVEYTEAELTAKAVGVLLTHGFTVEVIADG